MDLLWPGDHRAGDTFTDAHVVRAMVRVEQMWLRVLVEVGIAPQAAAVPLPVPGSPAREPGSWAIDDADLAALAVTGEDAGNPAVPLVALLRARLPEPAATWLHRGLTSQDVVDTALMLCAREALVAVESALAHQVSSMTSFVLAHRSTPMLARTLTQPAIASTLGVRAATWLTGLLDAANRIDGCRKSIPAQIGGAAGTLAAIAELAHGRGLADPGAVAGRAAELLAARLNLDPATPWHTARGAVTRIGDGLTSATDAWGRIAADVLTGSRAEIAELHEGARLGRGGSSTMPGKHNPVLSVLLRRAALAAPMLSATLHLAAGTANDDRPDGAWHAEWDTLRLLARRTVAAASQATELIDGLTADPAAMARNLRAATGIDAEQRAMAALAGAPAAETYRGATDLIIDRVVARATSYTGAGRPAPDPDARDPDAKERPWPSR